MMVVSQFRGPQKLQRIILIETYRASDSCVLVNPADVRQHRRFRGIVSGEPNYLEPTPVAAEAQPTYPKVDYGEVAIASAPAGRAATTRRSPYARLRTSSRRTLQTRLSLTAHRTSTRRTRTGS